MGRQYRQTAFALLIILVVSLYGTPAVGKAEDTLPTQYLAFQVFTGALSPNIAIGGGGAQPLSPPPSKATLKQFVQELVDQIGSTGDQHHNLAFIIGPLAL